MDFVTGKLCDLMWSGIGFVQVNIGWMEESLSLLLDA